MSAIGTLSTQMSVPAKAVCLVSGGIDSPVAAWLLGRQGVGLIFAYFDSRPLVSDEAERIALETIQRVGDTLPQRTRAYVIPHGQDLAEISEKCPMNLACLISRRLMLRVARQIAKADGAHMIVLGDALGQKASQTAQNLQVTDSAVTDIPIVRPLIGMNKQDVEKFARKIRTFELSTQPGVASCGVPTPHPRTHGRFDEIFDAERCLDIYGIVDRAVKNARVLAVQPTLSSADGQSS